MEEPVSGWNFSAICEQFYAQQIVSASVIKNQSVIYIFLDNISLLILGQKKYYHLYKIS